MNGSVLAIDPGPAESAYAWIQVGDCFPIKAAKLPNEELLRYVGSPYLPADHVAIEMVASYGMSVGREVFETCVWTGRFQQAALDPAGVELVYRLDVKKHHCHTGRDVTDANITQALIDRFAPGQPNRGKGTKTVPGWFYGFRADIWQAYALAVVIADRVAGRQ